MATLGDLVIKLSMDAAGFVSDAGKAQYQAQKFADGMRQKFTQAGETARTFGNQFQRALSGFGGDSALRKASESINKITASFTEVSAVGGVVAGVLGGVAIAATGMTAALTASAVSTAKQAQDMQDAADAAQVGVQAFQAMALTAEKSGIGVEQLVSAISKFNVQIAEAAQGSNQAALDFARLGVSATEGGKLRATEDVVRDVAAALAQLPRSAEKARIEMELFGKTGTRLDAFFKDFEEGTEQAAKSGALFSNLLIAQSEQLEAANKSLSQSFQAIRNQIAVAMLPSITALVKLFKDLVDSITKFAEETGLAAVVIAVASGSLKVLGLTVAVVADALGSLVDVFVSAVDVVNLLGLAAFKTVEALQRLKGLDFSGAKQSLLDIGEVAGKVADSIARRFGKPLHTTEFLKGLDTAAADAKKKAAEASGAQPSGGAIVKQMPQLQAEARAAFEAIAKATETARRQAQQEFQQANAELTRQASRTTLSIEDEYDKRIAAQKRFTEQTVAQYGVEIAAAQKLQNATVVGAKGRSVSLLDTAGKAAQAAKVLDLQQRQNEATAAGAEAEKQLDTQRKLANAAFGRQVQDVNAAVEELRGNLEAAADLRFDVANAELIAKAEAEQNKHLQRQLVTLKELTLQQVRFNVELQEVERIRNTAARTEAVIAAQVRSGRLTGFEAAAATNDLRRRTIALNNQEIAKLQQIGALTADQKQRIADLAAENEVLAASIDEVGKAINDAFIGAASDALVEFVEHTKSAQEAFNDFAKSVVHAINQMIAQELAKKLFRSMFGEDTQSGAAGIGGFLSGLFGASSAGAGGSTLAATSTTTTVAFANAMAGGGSFNANELLLVGEKGPELIKPSFSGSVIPNGQAAGSNVNVNMSISTPDASSFQRSQGQILTQVALASQRALARR